MDYERSGKAYLHDMLLSKLRNAPDTKIDRAYAERCVERENKENENVDPKVKKLCCTIPIGGKSKSARSKQNRTLGAIITQTTKALAQDKATPHCYRAEGIENALRSMLPIERGMYRKENKGIASF
jgi:hypothetical protein